MNRLFQGTLRLVIFVHGLHRTLVMHVYQGAPG